MTTLSTAQTTMTDLSTATLEVPGARLYYELRGAGPLVLLVGTPMDADSFASLADLTDGGWLQVFRDPHRAGGVAVNFAVDEFEQTLQALAQRGFDTTPASETPTGVQLLSLDDPDGNVTTVIGNVATS